MELSTVGFTGAQFLHSIPHSVCVMPFLAIFYRENADMSMELQDFLLVS